MPAFLDNDNYVVMLDMAAQRYSKRPSEIIGIEHGLVAFDFDLAIMAKARSIEIDGYGSTGSDENKKMKAQIANVQNMQRKGANSQG